MVETLFGFLDFEAFKKGILLSKPKNFLDEDYEKDERTQIDQPMTDTINLDFLKQLLSENINDPSLGWRKILESKGKPGF